MSTLAWLIRSNLGVRVACLSFDDGFDFHDNQVNRQAACLSSLGQTLAAFQADPSPANRRALAAAVEQAQLMGVDSKVVEPYLKALLPK